MYNEEQKQMYIEQSEGRYQAIRQYMTNQFSKTEQYEERLSKDLSCFNSGEIINYYKSICTSSLGYLICINSQFKMYTAWAQSRNLVFDNQNHYDELDAEILSKCINSGLNSNQVISADDIMTVIDELSNPSDKFVVLALFEGICGKQCEELIYLYEDNFYISNNMTFVKLCSGREMSISKQLYRLAMESIETYDYYTFNDAGNPKGAKYKDGDVRVIKSFRNATVCSMEHHNLYRKLNKIKSVVDFSDAIGAGTLLESGRISMVNSIIDSEHISFEECIRTHKEIEFRYGSIHSIPTYLKRYGEMIHGA